MKGGGQIKSFQKKLTLAKTGILKNFHKNHKKTTAPESLFHKVAGLQQNLVRTLPQQLARTLSGVWSSKNNLVKMNYFSKN